jgi:S-adenosylmethionine:tRNA ribosyltransferase-isomerase
MIRHTQATPLKLKDFQFEVPEEKIAQFPLEERDKCKTLVLDKKTGELEHRLFHEITDYFEEGDVLVINETKVLPARLYAYKEKTNGRIEIFLLRQLNERIWEALVKPARKVRVGNRLKMEEGVTLDVIDNTESGGRIIEFSGVDDILGYIERQGKTPLPPYIKREAENEDSVNYQTVYAKEIGAVAAPTAGLHFTDQLMEKFKAKGVIVAPVVLHVGLGTFKPVQVDDISKHQMHAEYYKISPETSEIINRAKQNGKKIVAVGTTVVRVLETIADFDSKVHPGDGWTDKFIYPPYQFKIVDNLITNFHTPGSSLIMLVAALAGYENIMKAYKFAINDGYRFFSYGDAMLIK